MTNYGNLYDKELEEFILGTILFNNETMETALPLLKAEMFGTGGHRQLYQTAVELHNTGQVLDILILLRGLEAKNISEEIGGETKLIKLMGLTVPRPTLFQYIETLKDKYLRRELIRLSDQMSLRAKEESVPLKEHLEVSEQDLFNISNKILKEDNGFILLEHFLVDVMEYIEDISEGKNNHSIQTGFYDLDSILGGGLKPQQLCILAARPGMGKSTFALNIAYNITQQTKKRVAIASFEMSKIQIGTKLISYASGVSTDKIIKESHRDSEVANSYVEALSEIASAKLSVWETGNSEISVLKGKTREEVSKSLKEEGFGLLVIDYLQLMEVKEMKGNRVLEMSTITRDLKKLAMELEIPILALSQLNREVENRTNKRPRLSDLRESGSLEQDADIVLMLYRDEYYNEDSTERGVAELLIAKQREGRTGTIKLNFVGETSSFRNLMIP